MEDRAFRGVVVITPETIYPGERDVIKHIVSRGGFVHVRKPKSDLNEIEHYCNSLEGDRAFMTLHYNHQLSVNKGFGGSHISLSTLSDYPSYNGRLTVSCHTASEALIAEESKAAYYFISPIFDSISKQGYRAAFDSDQLSVITTKCSRAVALGGVNLDNLDQLDGFNSIALLGAVWIFDRDGLNVDRSIDSFDQIFNRWIDLKQKA